MQDIHIGSLPPNLNGISIYLYRLSKIEKEAKFINWDKIMNFSKFLFWILKSSFSTRKKLNYIYHPPSLNQKIVLFLISLITPHTYSIIVHGNPIFTQYNQSSLFTRVLIRNILNRANYIQVVNPIFKRILRKELKIKNRNIFTKNAFLPPPSEDKKRILSSYTKKLLRFIDDSDPVLLSTASSIMFYKGKDLYGLDLCVRLTYLLKKNYPKVGFIFALANNKLERSYIKETKKKIKELGIKDHFLILTGNKEIWPLYENIDLFLRPTNRDGDSISVREALYFDCPVLASDVINRPNGTIIFKNRNLDDLHNKCIDILDNKI
jgi:hypothetical protein